MQRLTEAGGDSHTWETVSLEPSMYLAREQFNGVVFFMTDHHSLLSVLVTHEALREVAGKLFPDDEYLEQFETLRSEFELAANEKFISGEREADGSIRLKAADVAGMHCFAETGALLV
jgi:hypothetical protein